MTCYDPLIAFQSPNLGLKTNKGADKVVILGKFYNNRDMFDPNRHFLLPCGTCIGCRIKRSRDWTVRIMNEASLYSNNCFVTLTYDDEHLPADGTLVPRDLQLFIKRLRKKFIGLEPVIVDGEVTYPIRFYACGEYGSKSERPHYHLILFNFDFVDKQIAPKFCKKGSILYVSESLSTLWKYGISTIGFVTSESAGYVAKYCTKKILGDKSEEHYHGRQIEFSRSSNRPGIGYRWIEENYDIVYTSDCIRIDGKEFRPPKYYDEWFKDHYPIWYEGITQIRQRFYDETTDKIINSDLYYKELVKRAYLEKRERNVE